MTCGMGFEGHTSVDDLKLFISELARLVPKPPTCAPEGPQELPHPVVPVRYVLHRGSLVELYTAFSSILGKIKTIYE